MKLKNYLNLLYGPDFKGFTVEVRSWDPGQVAISPQTKYFKDPDSIIEYVEKIKEKRQIFLGVCPRRVGIRKSAKKTDVAFATCLWTDIDVKDMSYFKSKSDVIDFLNQFELPPTMIVDSGKGLHAYWKLKNPVLFKDDETRNEFTIRNAGISSACHGEAFDIPRILRMPGSIHLKNSDDPSPVKVIHLVPTELYEYEDFKKFDNIGAKHAKVSPTIVFDDMDVSLDTLNIDKELLKLITSGDISNFEKEKRSGRDYYIVSRLLELGIGPSAILSIYKQNPAGCGDKFEEKGEHAVSYLERTIQKAVVAIKERKSLTEHFTEEQKQVHAIIYGKGVARKKKERIAEFVLKILKEKARLFHIPNTLENFVMFFETDGGKYEKDTLINIDSSAFNNVLAIVFGINEADDFYKFCINSIRHYILKFGTKTTVFNFTKWDRGKRILYITDFGSGMYVLNGTKIEYKPNGFEGVLFVNKKKFTPYKIGIDDTGRNPSEIFQGTNFDPVLDPAWQGRMLKYFMYNIFFNPQEKPIGCAFGGKGSGKTIFFRQIGWLLFGDFEVSGLPTSEADFDTVISNSNFIVFDNYDNPQKWFPDRIARLATGEKIEKRILYTTNEMMSVKVDTFTCITTRNARNLSRADVIDRVVPFYLKQRLNKEDQYELQKNITDRRNEYLTYILHDINKRISNKPYAKPVPTRLASFHKTMVWLFGEKVHDDMGKLVWEQSQIYREFDNINDLILTWIFHKKSFEGNANQLFKEVRAFSDGDYFPYENPRSMVSKIGEVLDNAPEIKWEKVKSSASTPFTYKIELKDYEEVKKDPKFWTHPKGGIEF